MNRFEIRAPASRRKRDFDEGSAFDWPLLARYFAAELSSEERPYWRTGSGPIRRIRRRSPS